MSARRIVACGRLDIIAGKTKSLYKHNVQLLRLLYTIETKRKADPRRESKLHRYDLASKFS